MKIESMKCQEFKKVMDSFLSDELLVETNHDVLRHLESCPACRLEIAALRDFRAQVRAAAARSDEFRLNPVFSTKLRTGLKNTALRPSFFERIKHGSVAGKWAVAIAFTCLVLIVAGAGILVFDLGRSNRDESAGNIERRQLNPSTENATAQAIRASWNEMAHEAVGDHRNCALEFHLLEKPISLDDAARDYGAFNKGLGQVVISAINNYPAKEPVDGAELVEAHSCVFAGKRFAHLVLKANGKVVSVLVTASELPAGDKEIDEQQVDGMSVAGFRTYEHAVFVVSDLPENRNTSIANSIADAIRKHLENSRI